MRDGEPELGLVFPHELLHEGGLAGAGGAAEDHHQVVGGGGGSHLDVPFLVGGHIVTGKRKEGIFNRFSDIIAQRNRKGTSFIFLALGKSH